MQHRNIQIHKPFQNRKLIQLLQVPLGGKEKPLMFGHISPEPDSYEESISTLKIVEWVSLFELGTSRLNKKSGELRELKRQMDSLKKTLARKGSCQYNKLTTDKNARKVPGSFVNITNQRT